jgi:hypothetical protein
MTSSVALPGRTLAASLCTVAFVVSVIALALMVTRPAWMDALAPETALVTSIAVVPTLLIGAVYVLLAPTLRGTRTVPLMALTAAALGSTLLAVAILLWAEAFDAADEGFDPTTFARMWPFFALAALLLLWASLGTVHYHYGAQPARPFRRAVGAASTGIALTIAVTAFALSPPGHTIGSLGLLVFVILYARTGRAAPHGQPSDASSLTISPATPHA